MKKKMIILMNILGLKAILILVLCSMLSACLTTAAIVGATAGGAVVSDNRSTATMMDDRYITYQLLAQINADKDLKHKCHISVATFDYVVLLAGQAPLPEYKNRIESIAKRTPKVKRVYNQITISAPSDSMTQVSDDWVTAHVKAALLGKKGVSSAQLKVLTENGVVYLMGLTTKTKGDLAAKTTSEISGVQKVVKLFEYVH